LIKLTLFIGGVIPIEFGKNIVITYKNTFGKKKLFKVMGILCAVLEKLVLKLYETI
jgi:hypothetical protein